MKTSLLRRLSFLSVLTVATALAQAPLPAAAAATHAASAPEASPNAQAPAPAVSVPTATVTRVTAPPAVTASLAATAPPAVDTSPAATASPTAVAPPGAADDDSFDEPDAADGQRDSARHHGSGWQARHGRHHGGDAVVSIGHDSTLSADRHADSVVSILGSSTSEGEAGDVVSILGNTRVTGPLKDNAVAVLGNVYVDNKVDGNVVAVLGSVELGPHADIAGNVVAVLGTLQRDPAAAIHGDVENILAGTLGDVTWLHAWVKHCLIFARPLALAPGLGWAWTLALGFLALYFFFAMLFRPALNQCLHTVETHHGHTALAAMLSVLLAPVLIVLLCVTVVGIAVVPFVAIFLFCGGLFGKAVMLAWIGRRIVKEQPGLVGHPAFAVLIGGVIVLVLYLVPVLGFIVYKLLGIIGLGAVVYTLILSLREHQAAKAGRSAPPSEPAVGPTRFEPAAGPAPPSPQATAAMPHAGFWIRMAALLLDVVLIGFVLSLLHPMRHVHLLVLAIYGALMWKLRGSTLGGIIFDLRVVRVDGRPIDWETAIVRALGCFLSLAVVGLGFFWIAFDESRQAWHDKIAGTVVVRVPKGAPLP